jgi:hypothetical protein
MPPVIPVGKIAYLCDEVLQGPASGKTSYLGIFEDVVPPPDAAYPYKLGRLCVAAQLAGGFGVSAIHVEVVQSATQRVIRASGPFRVPFPGRRRVVTICVRLLCLVPGPRGVLCRTLQSGRVSG